MSRSLKQKSEVLQPQKNLASNRRMGVLVPYPVDKVYDYLVPDDMEVSIGDFVKVPLGRREITAVIWGAGDNTSPKGKLKEIIAHYNVPSLSEDSRKFIDWVSKYTLADRGSVLKMALSAPKALQEPKPDIGYKQEDNVDIKSLSEKRKRIWEFLKDNIPYKAADIAREVGCTPSIIKTMSDKGLLKKVKLFKVPPCSAPVLKENELSLSKEQQEAADKLVQHVKENKHSVTLLDGVTGAGKTEVYFEAVAETLKQGKQVLILVPEISLTTQFLERFERRFGTQPALWHSEVSEGKRRLTWRGIAEGKTKAVIGARSALFLPYQDLGLIIVDEEHDGSYKQEEGVIYNARDMAIVRGKIGNFPTILVSATPSLETLQNVQQGKYGICDLPSRFGGAVMPDVSLIDLKKEKPGGQYFISPPLRDALTKTFESGEQSLLFLNRRGYAPLTLCRTCGHRFQCPSCTAWLVEHRRHGRLQCHHCGYSCKSPEVCPECETEDSLAACGPGVERIYEEVRSFLPEARAMILASDITTSAQAIEDAIHKISNHEIDIIIGTQIIAKGHHFPSLTCVGIVDADLGLTGGDLRASERSFQLLHQVSGRAGRGEKPGQVFMQSFMPEHKVMQALSGNDRDSFVTAELEEREQAGMPPYGRLASLILSGPDERQLDQFARQLAVNAPRFEDVMILGPAPAALAILRGQHRIRFLIKTGKGIGIQKIIQQWLSTVKVPSKMRLRIDIDPQSFF